MMRWPHGLVGRVVVRGGSLQVVVLVVCGMIKVPGCCASAADRYMRKNSQDKCIEVIDR